MVIGQPIDVMHREPPCVVKEAILHAPQRQELNRSVAHPGKPKREHVKPVFLLAIKPDTAGTTIQRRNGDGFIFFDVRGVDFHSTLIYPFR